jgi:hypothetical protein
VNIADLARAKGHLVLLDSIERLFSGQMAHFLARAKRCTPSAWMMLISVPNHVLNPVSNRVLSVGHFIRAQVGHFS